MSPGGSDVKVDALVVSLGKDGRVTDYSFNNSFYDMNYGSN